MLILDRNDKEGCLNARDARIAFYPTCLRPARLGCRRGRVAGGNYQLPLVHNQCITPRNFIAQRSYLGTRLRLDKFSSSSDSQACSGTQN